MKTLVSQLVKGEEEEEENPNKLKEQWQQTQRMNKLVRQLRVQSILQISSQYLVAADMHSFVATCMSAGNSVILGDGLNALVKSARQQLRDLQTFGTRASHRFVMTSGTSMHKQFEPWYFGVAFCFFFYIAQACLICQRFQKQQKAFS